MPQPIRIVLADDHELVRKGLCDLLAPAQIWLPLIAAHLELRNQ